MLSREQREAGFALEDFYPYLAWGMAAIGAFTLLLVLGSQAAYRDPKIYLNQRNATNAAIQIGAMETHDPDIYNKLVTVHYASTTSNGSTITVQSTTQNQLPYFNLSAQLGKYGPTTQTVPITPDGRADGTTINAVQ